MSRTVNRCVSELLMDENFSDEGAGRFVEVFRRTMQLAGMQRNRRAR